MTKSQQLDLGGPLATAHQSAQGPKSLALFYYEADYIEEIADSTRDFLNARDRYIAAYVRFHRNSIGCNIPPEDEAHIMADILSSAVTADREAAADEADCG